MEAGTDLCGAGLWGLSMKLFGDEDGLKILSSNDYFFCKRILPPAFVGLTSVVVALVSAFSQHTIIDATVTFFALQIIFLPMGASYLWVMLCMEAKLVKLSNDRLYVSSCQKTIEVFYDDIEDVLVLPGGFRKRERIRIWLRRPTEFGLFIDFVPYLSFDHPHPVAAELQQLCGLTQKTVTH